MSTTTPKRGAPAAAGTTPSRRTPATTATPTSAARGASPSAAAPAAASPRNTPSAAGRPPRPASRRLAGGGAPPGSDDGAKEEEARAESAALVDSLRQSLKEAEANAEDYARQLASAQQKMDDLLGEQARLEEQYHERSERVQELEFEGREAKRHAQEMERIYDGERTAMMRDREEAGTKERELKATIQRLKETMAEREFRTVAEGGAGTPKGTDEPSFAPPMPMPRTDSAGSGRGGASVSGSAQKDQLIESLRLELAEAQIKLIESENRGGDVVQDLEKKLLETRMDNARLQEDNESFQLLLGERTISGDFQKTELMQGGGGSSSRGGSSSGGPASGLGSLAEELESAEGEHSQARRLEGELRSIKDQNKALTLYIEKIISRVLQHDNFETILDQKDGLGGIPGRGVASADKELPPPPPAKDQPASGPSGDGFLQRATSVVRRQRPVSAMFTTSGAPAGPSDPHATPTLTTRTRASSGGGGSERAPTALENPATAPSIPLGRAASVSVRGGASRAAHGRFGSLSGAPSTSPERDREIPGAAGIVNQMYRGSSPGPGGGSMSPLMSPGGARGYFASPGPNTNKPLAPRPTSDSGASISGVSDVSVASGAGAGAGAAPTSSARLSAEHAHLPADPASARASLSAASASDSMPASPPRDRAGNTQYTGAVMQQNRLRPLRLVQESEDEAAAAAAARKKANRGSWMGWFNRGKEEGGGGWSGAGLDRTEE